MTSSFLVTGGTGTLGRAVVDRLAATGHAVRTLSRSVRPPIDARVERVRGDLRTGAGLTDAATGADVIIHCATTNGRADVAATRNLIHAAAGRGHPHLVYISIVGCDRIPLGYYRAKRECEQLVEAAPLPWTILRATQFHDLIATGFGIQRRLPAAVAPAATCFQPIDVRELARELARIGEQPAAGRVPDIGGPEIRTALDLARTYRAAAGQRRAVLPISLPGKIARGFRRGEHLAPANPFGRTTFDEFLADSPVPPR